MRREASKREKERQEEQLKQIHTKQIKDKLMQISKTSYGQKMIEKIDKEASFGFLFLWNLLNWVYAGFYLSLSSFLCRLVRAKPTCINST